MKMAKNICFFLCFLRRILLFGTVVIFSLTVNLTAAGIRPGDRESPDASEEKEPDENEFVREREKMVKGQIIDRNIADPPTLGALRQVPRHRFVPSHLISRAYNDRPLPIGYGQTISQPYIVALMTSLIEPDPGDTVLEIGTGSGYQAAVLSPIVNEVYTIEIIEELANTAGEIFDTLGYENVKVKNADGYYGWEEYAPYDGIVVTAAAPSIPPPLIEQLKTGGVMVIPVGGVYQTQRLMRLEKKEDGSITSENIMPVRFVPFTREEE